MGSALKIYRASAGSGKTFNLALEYIRLLIQREDSFRHTLAVTFTNKATGEMKERILKELFLLATARPSAYRENLLQEFKLDEQQLQQRAASVLTQILHHYSHFSISTIDRFFQQVIRSLVRELGLYGGYRIELDDGKVLEEAVSDMMDALDHSGGGELLNWLIRFSEDKVEKSLVWNVKGDIQSLGREIFKETYRQLSSEELEIVGDKNRLKEYRINLEAFEKAFVDRLKELGRQAIAIAKRHGLNLEDFSYKKQGGAMVFAKWANGLTGLVSNRVLGLVDTPEAWYSKSSPTELKQAIEAAYGEMNICLIQGLELYEEELLMYNSIQEVFRNYYTLGLLSDLSRHIRHYEQEHHVMLLSDSSQLLQTLINGEDLPFVYEKIGAYINHFMIDEFQDTSLMQWGNFKPLLQNALASGYGSLVVGDVKQAIYRWRSSDWSLLSEQIVDELKGSCELEELTLPNNWRSREGVVHFNNAFFTFASQALQDKINASLQDAIGAAHLYERFSKRILKAYDSCTQVVLEGRKGGYVCFQHVGDNDKKVDVQAQVLEKIPEVLDDILSRGYRFKDIAILVRKGAEGRAIADYLMQVEQNEGRTYPFISDDALVIASAQQVQLMLAFLRFSIYPEDEENAFCLALLYGVLVEKREESEVLKKIADSSKDYIRSLQFISEEQRLLWYAVPQNTSFEACRAIQRLWHLSLSGDVFLQAFMDLVWEFEKQKGGGIQPFLQWWEDEGCRKTLESSAAQDAMRIMTIHKSKGLEFKVVLVPFADWNIIPESTQKTTLWCRPQVSPLDDLPLLPINYSKNLKDTLFADEYYIETIQSYVDNLNLAYVAFTRAEEELWGFISSKKESISTLLASAFALLASSGYHPDSPELELEAVSWDEVEGIFEVGTKGQGDGASQSAPVMMESDDYMLVHNPESKMMLHYRSKDFFTQNASINYGLLMHRVFCDIRTKADIPQVVRDLIDRGELTQFDAEAFMQKLYKSLEDERVSLWFSGVYEVYNERDILLPGGGILRPDRVLVREQEALVIDYKFGLHKDRKYLRQLGAYKKWVKALGYEEVKAYIWYFELGEIEEVFLV